MMALSGGRKTFKIGLAV